MFVQVRTNLDIYVLLIIDIEMWAIMQLCIINIQYENLTLEI